MNAGRRYGMRVAYKAKKAKQSSFLSFMKNEKCRIKKFANYNKIGIYD